MCVWLTRFHRAVWGLNKRDPKVPVKLGSILRISRKYHLRDDLDIHLREFFSSAWPQSLRDWDESEQAFRLLAAAIVDKSSLRQYAEDEFPEAASAIRLAQQVDLTNILPAAFYHLSRIPVSHYWDKKRQPAPPRSSRHFAPSSRSAMWYLLSASDLLRLLQGREKIQEFMVDNWASSVFVACRSGCCKQPLECAKRYHALTSLHSMLLEDDESYHDPLSFLQRRFSQPIAVIQERFNICEACAESAWRISMAKRAELWDLLPEFFGVSS